jgi:PIN domain nuclease of toxin-antitoxin system
MLVGLADTHTVIWYIFGNPKLSPTAKAFVDTATTNGDQIAISSITLIEMVYLIEKGRIAAQSFTRLAAALEAPGNVFLEVAPDLRVARTLSRVDATKVPDMPDRIIAATALYLNVPVISKDAKIQLSGLMTIW